MNRMCVKLVFLLFVSFSLANGFGSLKGRSPGTNAAFVPLWLKAIDANVVINDQIATTHIDETFSNTDASIKEGIFDFTLPEGSIVTQLVLWIGNQRCVAVPMQKTQATAAYDNSVRLTVDPALLNYVGNNEYQLNIYPLDPASVTDSLSGRRIELTYATPLKSAFDSSSYLFPLTTANLSNIAPESTYISISVVSQDTVFNVLVPNFSQSEIGIYRVNPNSYNLVYYLSNAYATKDLELNIVKTSPAKYRLTTATYVPGLDTTYSFDSTETNSYFVTWLTAPYPQSSRSREVVFVVDASYSMTGDRFSQIIASLKHALGLLSPTDKFNIISFNTAFNSFEPDLVAATPANISAAIVFLQNVHIEGITNLYGPLKQAMTSSWSSTTSNAIFLLTDGYINWPLRLTTAQMIDALTTADSLKVPLYTVALDEDADENFLSILSSQNGGILVTLPTADTAQGNLTTTLEQLMYPVLNNIKLNVIGDTDVYPVTLPSLPDGGQLLIMGRYYRPAAPFQPKAYQIALSGIRNDTAIAETLAVNFPVSKTNYHSIPQLWASMKVDYYLNQIELQGSVPSLINQVTALGLKYGIVTPYTSLLVLAPQSSKALPFINKLDKNEINTLQLSVKRVSNIVQIRYGIPSAGGIKNVSLKIYNLQGRLVRILTTHLSTGGWYIINWDRRDEHGGSVGMGTYVLVLEAGTQRIATSLHLVR